MSPRERYLQDPAFYNLVDMLNKTIRETNFTPTEMRQATVLACLKYEQSQPHLSLQGEVVDRATLREKFAVLAHRQWSGWMKYLFGKGTFNPDKTWTMPRWAVDRWQRQASLPFEELLPEEQETDRKEADRFLALIAESDGILVGGMKFSDVLKVWDILHMMDTGSMGFCDLEKALDQIIGVENDICGSCPSTPNPVGTESAPIEANQTP